MLNIIDELGEISVDRQTLLTEVLDWMEKYPPDSFPGLCATPSDEFRQYDLIEEEKLFTDCDMAKNIRRLTLISEDMGLVKTGGRNEGNKQDDKRKLLEEKMNKQKSRYIATKVFDGMSVLSITDMQLIQKRLSSKSETMNYERARGDG